MFSGNKPDWLYELLPYLYLTAGLATAFLLGHPIGVISGLLLASAGLVVWHMRRSYRAAGGRQPGHYDEPEPPARRPTRPAAELTWRASLESGHAAIDGQHRKLFELGNRVIHAMREGRPDSDVELLLYQLLGAFEKHCEAEAQALAEQGRPLSAPRREQLRAGLARARELESHYRDGRVPIDALVGFVTYDTLLTHVLEPHR